MNEGYLLVNVYADDISQPIQGANIFIEKTNQNYKTDENGQTGSIVLESVPIENSTLPGSAKPYETYNITVSKEGMTNIRVNNIEIFPGIKSIQNIKMNANDDTSEKEIEINLNENVLNGNYSNKFVENENTGTPYVLTKVILPEYIIVHDGIPNDNTAPNYNILFADYIKNVASSEIYPTWPIESLKANIIAIISFTLNRIYTEWYPSKGYNFTITSVTTYDQKYIPNRTIYDSISLVVDDILFQYLQRPGKNEPMLAQYCDGESLKEEGWLWQWGSADLANQKIIAKDILYYYYGNNLEIKTAEYQSGLPTSFPGYVLGLNSCGEEVKKIQNEINIVRGNYPGLIQIENPNGNFDKNTEDAIKKFQEVFDLKVTGIIDYSTWYRISYMYLAVARMIYGVYDR